MTDDEFIKAMSLPGAFPPLGMPKDPKQPIQEKESTDEAE